MEYANHEQRNVRNSPLRLHQKLAKRAPSTPKTKANPKAAAATTVTTTTNPVAVIVATTATTTPAAVVPVAAAGTGRTGAAFTGAAKPIADTAPTSAKALVTLDISAYNTLYTTVAAINTAYVPPNANAAAATGTSSSMSPSAAPSSSTTTATTSLLSSSGAADAVPTSNTNSQNTSAAAAHPSGIKLSKVALIGIIAGGSVLVILLIVGISVCCYKRKKSKKESKTYWNNVHDDPKSRNSMPVGARAVKIPDQNNNALGSKWTTMINKNGSSNTTTGAATGYNGDDEKTWGTRPVEMNSLYPSSEYGENQGGVIRGGGGAGGGGGYAPRSRQANVPFYGGVGSGNAWYDRDSVAPQGTDYSSTSPYDSSQAQNRSELLGSSSLNSFRTAGGAGGGAVGRGGLRGGGDSSISLLHDQLQQQQSGGQVNQVIDFRDPSSPRLPPAVALPSLPSSTPSSRETSMTPYQKQYPPSQPSDQQQPMQRSLTGISDRSTASMLGSSMLGMMTGVGNDDNQERDGNDSEEEEHIVLPRLASSGQEQRSVDENNPASQWGPLTNTLLPSSSSSSSSMPLRGTTTTTTSPNQNQQYNKGLSRVDSKPLRELEDILHSFSNARDSSSQGSRNLTSGQPIPQHEFNRSVRSSKGEVMNTVVSPLPSQPSQSSLYDEQHQQYHHQQENYPLRTSSGGQRANSSSTIYSQQPQIGRKVSLIRSPGVPQRLDRKESLKARSEQQQQERQQQQALQQQQPQVVDPATAAAEERRLKDIFRQTMLESDLAGDHDDDDEDDDEEDEDDRSSNGSEPEFDHSFGGSSHNSHPASSVATQSPTTPRDWNSSSGFLPQLPSLSSSQNQNPNHKAIEHAGGDGHRLQAGKERIMVAPNGFPPLSSLTKDPMALNYRSATESIYRMYD